MCILTVMFVSGFVFYVFILLSPVRRPCYVVFHLRRLNLHLVD